jgi:putative PIN family toxin of toxin-antitoxin system
VPYITFADHLIYQSLISGKFNLSISVDILLEYEEVLQQKYSLATAQTFVTLLNELPNVHHALPHYKWQLISTDPDDNKYCDCAIAGKALYIVTEDKHFDSLKNISFPSLTVIGIDHFLQILQSM